MFAAKAFQVLLVVVAYANGQAGRHWKTLPRALCDNSVYMKTLTLLSRLWSLLSGQVIQSEISDEWQCDEEPTAKLNKYLRGWWWRSIRIYHDLD